MKSTANLFFLMGAVLLFSSCKKEADVQERFAYETEKVIDQETGDEYLMEQKDSLTIVHKDGSSEKIAVQEAPFYGEDFIKNHLKTMEAQIEERLQTLLIDKKNKIKEARRARYAALKNEELVARFHDSHKKGEDLSVQIDMIAELIERGVINNADAPTLLEISPDLIDLDIDLENLKN